MQLITSQRALQEALITGTPQFSVWSPHTRQFWVCTDCDDLNVSFVFTDDLEITTCSDSRAVTNLFNNYYKGQTHIKRMPTVCHLFYNDDLKIYEPHNTLNYAINKYGKPIPRGMISKRFPNRFERDTQIAKYIADGYVSLYSSKYEEVT